MFDVHGFKPVSFENLPHGGHGYPGRTLDTLLGSGLEFSRTSALPAKSFDAQAAARIRRRVRFGFGFLFAGVSVLLVTVGVLLSV